MVKIKCVFPKNYYLLRKVNVKISNKTIAHIGHNEVIELDVFEKDIKFKLDYHKTKIKVPDSKTEKYLILYFNFSLHYSQTNVVKFVDVEGYAGWMQATPH